MRNVAGFALTTASAFLAVVAIMLNSPALFYMATALIATIAACHFQAWLAVRALRFERIAPETARVGDLVTVEIFVWSERKLRRPLITVYDNLPARILLSHRSPSLPVAPAYDLPIRAQYQFRPLKRGKYRWSGVTVEGTDALGLITKRRSYDTEPAEMTVLPSPIALSLDIPSAAGWGISEAESGQSRGVGIEPRGIREYANGDALRHVHWRSSARAGRLLVKEFEAGSHASASFFIQDSVNSEVGIGANTSLETMCGNVAFLADAFLRQGVRVLLPAIEGSTSRTVSSERIHEIYEALSTLQPESKASLGEQVIASIADMTQGSIVFVLCAVRDDSLPGAVAAATNRGLQVIALLYDANKYPARSRQPRTDSAVQADFIGALTSAGADPFVVPITEVTV
ncbi:MAG: DUF58 domain-containing protein [Fimbriimonas sp.]